MSWHLKTPERRQRQRLRAYHRRRSRHQTIDEIKSRPCADCGGVFPPYVMDFDHVRGEKLFNIALKVDGSGLPRLLAEIAKCDVVCSNCHRVRTWKRSHE